MQIVALLLRLSRRPEPEHPQRRVELHIVVGADRPIALDGAVDGGHAQQLRPAGDTAQELAEGGREADAMAAEGVVELHQLQPPSVGVQVHHEAAEVGRREDGQGAVGGAVQRRMDDGGRVPLSFR